MGTNPTSNSQKLSLATERAIGAATLGDAGSQMQVAGMYAQGTGGLKKNDKLAFSWCAKAAAQCNRSAQTNLASMYASGLGVEADQAKAAELYKQAADAGVAEAQASIGDKLYHGDGVKKDANAAFGYLSKAAKAGVPRAQFSLGVLFLKGEGVKKDSMMAGVWIQNAAQGGIADAQFTLGMMYAKGEGGLPQDVQLAMGWTKKAAEQGHVQAKEITEQSKPTAFAAFYDGEEGEKRLADAQAAMAEEASSGGVAAAVAAAAVAAAAADEEGTGKKSATD
jgi:TPR repeat protein